MGALDVYQKLPVFLQNMAVSAYGAAQYRQRYSGPLPEPYADLSVGMSADGEQLAELQWQRLRQLIQHASSHVPYYRDHMQQIGANVEDVTPDSFAEIFPVLRKETLLAQPDRFHSEVVSSGAVRLFTSGTSGSPMPILASREARRINYAYYRALLLQAGCHIRDRSATFAGRLLVSPQESRVFWRLDSSSRTMYCSSYHLSERTIPAYINALEHWSPQYIDSYPSAIGAVAGYLVDRGLETSVRPKVIFTSSETLTPVQQSNIERAFQCPVLDQYGCSEMAVMAWRLGGERYQIEPLYGLAEFEPVDDETSALICTGLINEAMPLLRYKIGDAVQGARRNGTAPLGASSFETVEGRIDDLITTPEGRKVGRMDPAFKGVNGVKLAQIHQASLTELIVKVVFSDEALKEQASVMIAKNIQERTSPRMSVKVEAVQHIPVTRAGKLKAVTSDVR